MTKMSSFFYLSKKKKYWEFKVEYNKEKYNKEKYNKQNVIKLKIIIKKL